MITFTLDQWLILGLTLLIGFVLGMAAMASPKWKNRYREEVSRREAVEAENARLKREASEMDSLRSAAARDEARRREAAVPAPEVAPREPVRAETLRDEADRVEPEHPGEAESLREAAERDEERRRAETRPL
jgi:hypothetical protein